MSNIKLKQLNFSNMFSYGSGVNTLNLNNQRITQLTAVNGCLPGSAIILGADGSAYTIKQIVDQKLSIDIMGVTETNEPTITKVIDWFEHAPNLVYKVTFDNGNTITVTDNHELKTIKGWLPLRKIHENDWVQDSRYRSYSDVIEVDATLWKLYAYILGSGSVSDNLYFVLRDEQVRQKVAGLINELDANCSLDLSAHRVEKLGVIYKDADSVESILSKFSIPEFTAEPSERCFPAGIFQLSDDALDQVLAAYFEVFGDTEPSYIQFLLRSDKAAYQILHLLRYRYGLYCTLKDKTKFKNYKHIVVNSSEDSKTLAARLLPHTSGARKAKLEAIIRGPTTRLTPRHDLVPLKLVQLIPNSKAQYKGKLYAERLAAYRQIKETAHGLSRTGYINYINKRFVEPIDYVDNTRYSRIISITCEPREPVYDIQTTTGNFIYGDTLVHNSGKSSLALIIQELLYSKNVKGIKKGDILNRYPKEKTWWGKLDFEVDGAEYAIIVKRSGAATKVELYRDGIDISEHKVIDTYKKVQDILGLDFEIFSQITYQSSVDLLDFLKATDSNRKKFLINLFNLEKYTTIGEKLKPIIASKEKDVLQLQGEKKSINDFLQSVSIPDYMLPQTEPEIDASLAIQAAKLELQLTNISDLCRRIDKNNMYISERDALVFDIAAQEPANFEYTDAYQTLKLDLTSLNNEIAKAKKELINLRIEDKCPACGQPIDNSHLVKIKQDTSARITKLESDYAVGLQQAQIWSKQFEDYQKARKAFKNNQDAIHRFEQLSQLIDKTLPTQYPDYNAISAELKQIKQQIAKQTEAVKKVNDYNKLVSSNNAKIEALKEQKAEFIIRQNTVEASILNKSSELSALAILKKAFSTSGIVAYKLEYLTKTLEDTINYYLALLSDGQFQIEFELSNEKLNINVVNNGISSPIETVSGGEFSRIQTSILLAIRSLLSTLGGSSINLLFLDEITGVLDADGKDKLLEVLQREENLNVFLISHDFTHPLIDKIQIDKTNNISTIKG